MNTRYIILYVLFGLLVVLTACGSGAQVDEPPTIRYGEDECVRCRMLIQEPRFAAAYVTQDGTVRRFDDIGGMILYLDEQGEDVATYWVHDYDSEEWLNARDAVFVLSENLHTPMGFGVGAFAGRERAQDVAAETDGQVLSFEELQTEVDPGEMKMDAQMHDHSNP